MNKGDLILAVRSLLAKMESWEAAYELSPEFTDAAYADKVDAAGALAIKTFVTKLLTTIDEPSSDAVGEAAKLKRIDGLLRGADKDYSKILRNRCLPLTLPTDRAAQEKLVLKRMFEVLGRSLKRDISKLLPSQSSPSFYKKDSICKEVTAALKTSYDTSSKLLDSLTPLFTSTPGVSEQALQQAINALDSANQQLVGSLHKVQQRRAIIDKMIASYDKLMVEKDQFLENIKSILTISDASLALIGDALSSHIRVFKQQVDGYKRRSPNKLEDMLSRYGDSFDRTSVAVGDLSKETKAQWAVADKLIKDVERLSETLLMGISHACEHFQVVYTTLSEQFDEAHVDRKAINAINERFQQALERQDTGVNDIYCLHRKSAELTAIIKDFESNISRLIEPAKSSLIRKMKLIKERINDQIDATLKEVRDNQYRLDRPEEKYLIQILRSFRKESGSEPRSSLDALVGKHRSLVEKEKKIITIIEELNKHLRTHEMIATILKKDGGGQYNFTELATFLSTSTSTDKDRVLFTTLGNYFTAPARVPEEQFLSQLASQLNVFDDRGLDAIKEFIAQKDSQSANDIKEKLAFISICRDKAILYDPYLDNPLVVKAIVQLKAWQFDKQISFRTCESPGFLNAVCLLNQYKIKPTLAILEGLKTVHIIGALDGLTNAQIPLTHDLLQRLLDDPIKCDLICQQNAYRESLLPGDRIQPYAFKGVLEDILNIKDRAVINALREIGSTEWSKSYLHSMLYLLNANSSLTAVLGNKLSKESLPFLCPLIKQLPNDAGSLNAFWREDGKRIGDPAKKAHNYIRENKYGSTLLRRLSQANKTPSAYGFTQMSQFMSQFNTYLDDIVSKYQKKDSDDFKEVVEKYRRRTVQTLLTVSSPKQKKECLEELTRKTFKQKNQQCNVFLDLLQMISLLWIVIIPVRLALNRSAFFSEEKSKIHHDISRLTEQLDGPATGPSDDSQRTERLDDSETKPSGRAG